MTTNMVELAREVAAETGDTDSVGQIARLFARTIVEQSIEHGEFDRQLRLILATCIEVGELPEVRTSLGFDAPTVAVRQIADMLVTARAELTERRAADLTREEAEALRGCSVHSLDEERLKLACAAIDKTVARTLKEAKIP